MNGVGNVINTTPLNYLFHSVYIYRINRKETSLRFKGSIRKAYEFIKHRKNVEWEAAIRLYLGTKRYAIAYYHFRDGKFVRIVKDRAFEEIPSEWVIEAMKGERDEFLRKSYERVVGIYTKDRKIPYILVINHKEKTVKHVGYYRTSETILNKKIECKGCYANCKFYENKTIPPCINTIFGDLNDYKTI